MALNVMRKEETKSSLRAKFKKGCLEHRLSRQARPPFLQCDNLGLRWFRAYIKFLHKFWVCVFNYRQTLLFFHKSPVDAI
jgi:hypothetical protein